MELKFKYFGLLADELGLSNELRKVNSNLLSHIREELESQYWQLKTTPYRVAVNQEMVEDELVLTEGDELAFLPPFAGG